MAQQHGDDFSVGFSQDAKDNDLVFCFRLDQYHIVFLKVKQGEVFGNRNRMNHETLSCIGGLVPEKKPTHSR